MIPIDKRNNLVKSIIKAFDVIETLSNEHELGITEISNKLGIDKSTVFRIISTLKEKGIVEQNSSNQKYHNSLRLFELGNRVVEDLGLRRVVQPVLKELAEITGETVNLAVLDGDNVVYIDKIESSATIKVDLPVGKRLPIYCTGLGKVIIAFSSKEKLDSILNKVDFKKFTKTTHSNKGELLKALQNIREMGYSLDNEEYVEGLSCIAVPIRNYKGEAIAAISIAVPLYRYDKFIENGYKDLIVSKGKIISNKFGYREKFYI